MRIREKIAKFMYGRNGTDAYSLFLLVAAVVFLLLARLFAFVPLLATVFDLAYLAVLVYCVWRMFSRDLYKRQQENAKYYERQQAVMRWLRSWKDRWQQRKEYRFFRCPSCHALLRVPRGKGKLCVTCRKCGNRFEHKS